MAQLSPEAIEAKLLKKKKIAILKELQRRKGVTPLNHIREHDKQLAMTLCNLTNRWFFGGNRDLAYGSQIRMADGTLKRIEDVVIGDRVLSYDGENSVPSTVIDIPYDDISDCLEFTLYDGRKIVASSIHEWPVRLNNEPKVKRKSSQQLADMKVKVQFISAGQEQYTGAKLPFSGLVLGLYLGDGGFGKSPAADAPRPNFSRDHAWIQSLFVDGIKEAYGDAMVARCKPSDPTRLYIRSAVSKKGTNLFANDLAKLGLTGKAPHKFIPDVFKKSSVKDRLGIIKGLILTDGCVDKHHVTIYSASDRMLNDVKEVLRSLGAQCAINERIREDAEPQWSRQFYLKFSITWLFRWNLLDLDYKTPKVCPKKVGQSHMILSSVKDAGKVRARCLTVDHPSHTFVLEGNIVTFNTGKSEWLAHEVARFLHKRHPVIPLSGPLYKGKNIEGWCACPSFDVQEETTQPKILSCLDPSRILDQQRLRGDILLKLVYKADDGTSSTLNFKSYEQGRAKFQGAGKDFVCFDEEPPFDVYEEAIMRSKAGFPLYTWCAMTPVNGMTWCYDQVYLRTDDPRLKVISAEWDDNCFLTEEQKEEMESRFTPDALLVRQKGLFVQRVGLVCSWFNRSTHLVDNIMERIPKGSDVYSGTDFGYSKPCAHVFVAVDSDDNHYIFDGFYKTFLQNPQIADLIKRKEKAIQEAGLVMRSRYADSAQPSDIAELTTMGLPMIPVKKETGESQEGWDEHRARRMDLQGRVQPGTGKPKLYISSALVEVDDKARKGERDYNWMLKEVENLRWDEIKQAGRMVQKPRWSDKNAKHACFPAGTKVLTTNGEVAIEEIRSGMSVITPFGNSRVLSAGMTSEKRCVRSISFADGSRIFVTGDHPVFVYGRGLIEIDSLMPSDILVSCKHIPLSNLMAGDTDLMGDIMSLHQCVRGLKGCMWQYGRRQIIDRFRRGSMCITKIMIGLITLLRISRFFQGGGTFRITQRFFGLTKTLESGGSITSLGSDTLRKLGTVPERGELGIQSTEKELGLIVNPSKELVAIARKYFYPSSRQELNFVLASALVPPEENPAWMILSFLVRSALSQWLKINMFKRSFVTSVQNTAVNYDVYNLTTEHGVYYANGFLVSNCDAYTYMLTMYAAPPESATALAKRRREESMQSIDVFEDEGWVA